MVHCFDSFKSWVRVMVKFSYQNNPGQQPNLWHFSITKKLSNVIEKVQKSCLFIILGQLATSSYFCNLKLVNLDLLSERRQKLCTQFAKKTFKHPVHGKMFTKNIRPTREGRNVIVPRGKTVRYNRSSVPSLSRMLNF